MLRCGGGWCEGGGCKCHSIANIRVLLDLGATKVLINEVTSKAPNPMQELVHRLVIVV